MLYAVLYCMMYDVYCMMYSTFWALVLASAFLSLLISGMSNKRRAKEAAFTKFCDRGYRGYSGYGVYRVMAASASGAVVVREGEGRSIVICMILNRSNTMPYHALPCF